MSEVRVRGQLICTTEEQARVVRLHLPEHIALTRDEPGCRSFTVTATDDPMTWTVEERFDDESAFEEHRKRVTGSEWGRVTTGIERRYSIEGHPR
ncbi:putative quinol monooxygenase [Microbacterium sp. P03]|uniref:putative quinol monooxygenase n=1 Tax=Microbacterium sp. P03 TaxID=3366946 RepID=UPI00374749EB